MVSLRYKSLYYTAVTFQGIYCRVELAIESKENFPNLVTNLKCANETLVILALSYVLISYAAKRKMITSHLPSEITVGD